MVVVLYHVTVAFRMTAFNGIATTCVMIFFLMSGYVLARGYDGRPLVFMARRFIRLWPLYGLCLVAGYAVLGRLPPIGALLWLMAPPVPNGAIVGDPPAWSLWWEAWASAFFPAAFWLAERGRTAILAVALALGIAAIIGAVPVYPTWFVAGVAASRFNVRWPEMRRERVTCDGGEKAKSSSFLKKRTKKLLSFSSNLLPLWLGRVSYSLYLSHAVVMLAAIRLAGPWGVVASVPVMLTVAWGLERWVERPSVRWSRRVGR
jgi:peptidoglycan/LPS O-acetylase OafA/YrhL